jgi:hypothetical protein
MTGGEIVAAGATAALKAGADALAEDPSTKARLYELGRDSVAMHSAAEAQARRLAVKQEVLLKLWQPFAKWFGVSEAYFRTDFAGDLAAKMVDVPESDIVAPQISVAAPAVQGLSYSLEEPDLKEMYLNLLAGASDKRRVAGAHPSFAEIIKQLSPEEARLLQVCLKHETVAIVQIRLEEEGQGGYSVILDNVVGLFNPTTGQPLHEPRLAVWIDNWERLGLVRVRYDQWLVDPRAYDWVDGRPEMVAAKANAPEGKVTAANGTLVRTNFGSQFQAAVCSSASPMGAAFS